MELSIVTEPALVSIVIPVKDRIDWFRETLESVFNQSYSNIEVIIVDDGSSPPVNISLPNLSEQPNVIILRNETNQGLGAARERGRLAAKGSYINYLDSDDILHKDKIREQVKALSSDPKAGMCYCTVAGFRETPITGKEFIWSNSDLHHKEITLDIILNHPWKSPGACLWRREATNQIGSWIPEVGGDSVEYDFRAGCMGIRIIHLPETLFYYRRSRTGNQMCTGNLINRRLYHAEKFILVAKTAIMYLVELHDPIKKFIANQLAHGIFVFLYYGYRKKASESWSLLMGLSPPTLMHRIIYRLLLILIILTPVKLISLFRKLK